MSKLQERYKEVVPELLSILKYDNKLALPRIEKIVVNMGVGKSTQNKALLDSAVKDLAVITGQKPILTKAHKSVASFKLRRNQQIGAKVTLRRKRMFDFLERLISIVLPRIRDFRGLSLSGFDQEGNYSFGIKEQGVFPEIDISKITNIQGMDITICIKSRKKDDAIELLKKLGFPLRVT